LGKIWKEISVACFKLLSQHILENNEIDYKIAGLQEFVKGMSGAEQSFILGQAGYLNYQ
jgi:hypothetical protein